MEAQPTCSLEVLGVFGLGLPESRKQNFPVTFMHWHATVTDPGFLQGGVAAGAFGVPQAPSCPLSLRPLRKFRGS